MKFCLLKFYTIFLMIIPPLRSERRIQNGALLEAQKKYLVYFVKSEESKNSYSGWTCGGAIITDKHILTAAACVEDVSHLYAIAGFEKYVPLEQFPNNDCTNILKKRVIHTCVPKSYELDYANIGKWAAIDIAVATVDSPYSLSDLYEKLCTYKPQPIRVNYDPKYQQPGVDGLVMGWGHLEKWRQPGDNTIYIQNEPRYAPTQILNKRSCKEMYSDLPELQVIIDKYMICTKEPGNINDRGYLISTLQPNVDGCDDTNPYCRRNLLPSNKKSYNPNITDDVNTRRQGICQNDHGGPLVTWVGSEEVLIGIASVFRINAEGNCVGPFLFTSTQCNSAFIYCAISNGGWRKNSICDQPPTVRGFDMINRRISWDTESDGNGADDEKIQIRPQIPITYYS